MTGPIETRKRFMVGKYEIVAEPMQYAMHMLRYSVYLNKKRLGGMVSMPSESDCLFMEKPPVVPPLKIFYVTSKPGRPSKNAPKLAVALEKDLSGFREAIPSDVPLEGIAKPEDR